jgi:signal transduction histidine kinase
MTEIERPDFNTMLRDTMMAYGKPMPEASLAKFWWEQLSCFPFQTVQLAISAYRQQEMNFAPVPNAIIVRCLQADGRPTADEAWNAALESRDESATVIWTEETAEALAACREILNLGDKIGARRTFIDAYTRLVLAARGRCLTAKWIVSLGTDKARQQQALGDGVRLRRIAPNEAYMLPAPKLTLLPGMNEAQTRAKDRENVERLRSMMASLESAHDKLSRQRQQDAERQRERDRIAKEASKRKVTEFIDQLEGQNAPV